MMTLTASLTERQTERPSTPERPSPQQTMLAWKLFLFLATHEVDEYVSPKGYRFKKIARCAGCETGHPRSSLTRPTKEPYG